MWRTDPANRVKKARTSLNSGIDEAVSLRNQLESVQDTLDAAGADTTNVMEAYQLVERYADDGMCSPLLSSLSDVPTVPTAPDARLDESSLQTAASKTQAAERAADDLKERTETLLTCLRPPSDGADVEEALEAVEASIEAANHVIEALEAAEEALPTASVVREVVREAVRDDQLDAALALREE